MSGVPGGIVDCIFSIVYWMGSPPAMFFVRIPSRRAGTRDDNRRPCGIWLRFLGNHVGLPLRGAVGVEVFCC